MKEKARYLIAVVISVTFLWNQCIWAIGLETVRINSPANLPVKFEVRILNSVPKLPSEFTKTFEKVLDNLLVSITKNFNFEAKWGNIEEQDRTPGKITSSGNDALGRIVEKTGMIDGQSYEYESNSFDIFGRSIDYTETIEDVEYTHSAITFDALGRVTAENIEVHAEQGMSIFKQETEILTEYEYGYNTQGIRETTYENEVYNRTTSNPIGKIVKFAIGIATIAVTWGMAVPAMAAILALEDLVMNVLSGADFTDALITAGISFAAVTLGAAVGGYLSSGPTGAIKALTKGAEGTFWQSMKGFGGIFQALTLTDILMVDDQGRSLYEQVFGEWAGAIISGISVLGGLMGGGLSSSYQMLAGLGKTAVSALTTVFRDQLGKYWSQFLNGFITQGLTSYANQETAQKQRNADLTEAGLEFDEDFWGNAINIHLPQAIIDYANGVSQNITTCGLDNMFKALAASALAIQRTQEVVYSNTTEETISDYAVTPIPYTESRSDVSAYETEKIMNMFYKDYDTKSVSLGDKLSHYAGFADDFTRSFIEGVMNFPKKALDLPLKLIFNYYSDRFSFSDSPKYHILNSFSKKQLHGSWFRFDQDIYSFRRSHNKAEYESSIYKFGSGKYDVKGYKIAMAGIKEVPILKEVSSLVFPRLKPGDIIYYTHFTYLDANNYRKETLFVTLVSKCLDMNNKKEIGPVYNIYKTKTSSYSRDSFLYDYNDGFEYEPWDISNAEPDFRYENFKY